MYNNNSYLQGDKWLGVCHVSRAEERELGHFEQEVAARREAWPRGTDRRDEDIEHHGKKANGEADGEEDGEPPDCPHALGEGRGVGARQSPGLVARPAGRAVVGQAACVKELQVRVAALPLLVGQVWIPGAKLSGTSVDPRAVDCQFTTARRKR